MKGGEEGKELEIYGEGSFENISYQEELRKMRAPNTCVVYAHRGFSAIAPENTMVAFQKALDFGATGIELDVQLSKDGVVMVCHDEKVDRTTDGQGFLVDYTCAELQKLDAGSWFCSHEGCQCKKYQGVTIPTLKEVLELLTERPANATVELNIELKTGIVDYPELEEKVLELTHQYGIHSRTIFSSFNHYSLKKMRELDSKARIGVLYIAGIYEPWEYVKQFAAEAIHPIFYNIRPELVKQAHRAGIKVNPFTVNEPGMMKKMIDCGVDGVITNYPDRLLSLLKQI